MKKVMTAMAMSAVILLAESGVSPAEQAAVQSVIRGTKIAKVERGDINGMYKAFMDNGRILYVFPFDKRIFFGEVYTSSGQSVTRADREKWEAQISEKKLKKVDLAEIKKISLPITYGRGGEYTIVAFTDPQCPFCKKAEGFISSTNATVEYIYTVQVPQHRMAPGMIKTILSSKEPRKTIEEYLDNKPVTTKEDANVDKRMQAMESLARKYGISGTPNFIVFDKDGKAVEIIRGADIEKLKPYVG